MRMLNRTKVRRGSAIVAAGVLLTLTLLGSPGGARAQPVPDPTLLEELATRLLSPLYPGPTGVDPPPAQLLPGAVPDDLPLELPFPPDSRLIGSIVRSIFSGSPVGPATTESVEVVLDVPASPAAVLAFYEQSLPALGFTQASPGPRPRPGGFLSSTGSDTPSFFCRGTEGPFIEVVTRSRREQPTDLRLRIQSFAGPCATPPNASPSPPPDPLPPLEPPAGMTVLVGGSGGSPLSRSSEAIAETSMSVTALEAHYADQLMAAGWRRTAGGAEGPLAWSIWQVPGGEAGPFVTLAPGERQGILTVVAGPGADRRSLHLSVVSGGALTGGPVPVPR